MYTIPILASHRFRKRASHFGYCRGIPIKNLDNQDRTSSGASTGIEVKVYIRSYSREGVIPIIIVLITNPTIEVVFHDILVQFIIWVSNSLLEGIIKEKNPVSKYDGFRWIF